MPLFMTLANYTAPSFAKFIEHPQDRAAPLRKLIEEQGCRLVSLYFTFGDQDAVLIFEAPDAITAAALMMAAMAAGHLDTTDTRLLLTPEEAQEAMTRAHGVAFPPPQ